MPKPSKTFKTCTSKAKSAGLSLQSKHENPPSSLQKTKLTRLQRFGGETSWRIFPPSGRPRRSSSSLIFFSNSFPTPAAYLDAVRDIKQGKEHGKCSPSNYSVQTCSNKQTKPYNIQIVNQSKTINDTNITFTSLTSTHPSIFGARRQHLRLFVSHLPQPHVPSAALVEVGVAIQGPKSLNKSS